MAYTTKIATCCYCGARAALVLDQHRHELACANCGAPLHDMKRLPQQKTGKRDKPRERRREGYEYERSGYAERSDHGYAPKKYRKRKRRKSVFHKLIEEAVDIIEDIID